MSNDGTLSTDQWGCLGTLITGTQNISMNLIDMQVRYDGKFSMMVLDYFYRNHDELLIYYK